MALRAAGILPPATATAQDQPDRRGQYFASHQRRAACAGGGGSPHCPSDPGRAAAGSPRTRNLPSGAKHCCRLGQIGVAASATSVMSVVVHVPMPSRLLQPAATSYRLATGPSSRCWPGQFTCLARKLLIKRRREQARRTWRGQIRMKLELGCPLSASSSISISSAIKLRRVRMAPSANLREPQPHDDSPLRALLLLFPACRRQAFRTSFMR